MTLLNVRFSEQVTPSNEFNLNTEIAISNMWEKIEDTKGVIRRRKSKDRQDNGKKKMDKQQSTEHKTKILRLTNTNTL
jgi:hypothetical protein